jgi:hypothetical protein
MIGVTSIKNILCIACGDLLGKHSKKEYMKCIFRLQGTIALMDEFPIKPNQSGLTNMKNKSDVISNNKIKVMRRVKDG